MPLDDLSGMDAPMGPFTSDDVQYQIASPTVEKANGNKLTASVMQKMGKWKTQQVAGYEAMKDHLKKEFHGLQDFMQQEDMKSKAHYVLMIGWKAIKQIAMKNLMVLATMFTDRVMGPVGKALKMIDGFAQAFAMDPDAAQDPQGALDAAASNPPDPLAVNAAVGGGSTDLGFLSAGLPTAPPSFGG